MSPRSLRLRLLLGAMIAIFAALAVAWAAMLLIFERHIQRRVEDDLQRAGVQLIAGLSLDAAGRPVLEPVALEGRFQTPASGRYWQVATPAAAQRSRSLWDQALPRTSSVGGDWRSRLAPGPFEPSVLLVERRVRPDRTARDVVVQVAENAASLRAERDEFGGELGLFLALLWAVLSAAAWAQVRLGLRPLDDVRQELQGLQRSAATRLAGSHPREIQPLVEAINALADIRETDLRRARRRAGDLAHSLKTPLAALSAQSRRARAAGATEAADGLDHAIETVAAAVETELARARAASVRNAECAAAEVVERLVQVLERTDAGAVIVIDVDPSCILTAPLAAEDLTELLGPLMENAVRHARRQVRISGASGADAIRLTVEDDGPGIGADRTAEAIVRGARLDEAGSGHGLGLAIARDLAEATGGRLELSQATLGGLAATVLWPAGGSRA